MRKTDIMPTHEDVVDARNRWLEAQQKFSEINANLFPSGAGYGCPEALETARHGAQIAKDEADRRRQIYHDRPLMSSEILKVQRSQTFSTWAISLAMNRGICSYRIL